MIFFITTMLALLYGLLGEFSIGLLLTRLAETAAGAVIGIGVAYVVLPTSTRDVARQRVRDLLDALAAAGRAGGRTGWGAAQEGAPPSAGVGRARRPGCGTPSTRCGRRPDRSRTGSRASRTARAPAARSGCSVRACTTAPPSSGSPTRRPARPPTPALRAAFAAAADAVQAGWGGVRRRPRPRPRQQHAHPCGAPARRARGAPRGRVVAPARAARRRDRRPPAALDQALCRSALPSSAPPSRTGRPRPPTHTDIRTAGSHARGRRRDPRMRPSGSPHASRPAGPSGARS